MNNNQEPMRLNINLEECADQTCPKCGGLYFSEVFRMKKVSAVQSPMGQPFLHPIPMARCIECGHILQKDEISFVDDENVVQIADA